jgi:hypothetical protein
MSKQSEDPWCDPMVKAALKDGRQPNDIFIICCPDCNRYTYYNQGSYFDCRFCDYSARGESLDLLLDADEAITLDDYTDSLIDRENIP